jgi:hypothetical protein
MVDEALDNFVRRNRKTTRVGLESEFPHEVIMINIESNQRAVGWRRVDLLQEREALRPGMTSTEKWIQKG